jgi:hypothetical protein
MNDDSNKVIGFPTGELPPEERARRLTVEVERLAGLPVVEWMFYLPDVAKKQRGDRSRCEKDG